MNGKIKIDELFCIELCFSKVEKHYGVLRSIKEQEMNITKGKSQVINLGSTGI